ncbi:MAG: hypothetical protein E6767_06245 [Dysgonomonas sp.]|nr:hypothetical protein [Dysgonomonas sp.]
MADIFDIDRNLDSYIARYIRKTLFVNGMEYNYELKKFEPVKPNPTNVILRKIEEECCQFFGIKEDGKTSRVLEAIEIFRKRVQETTSFDPVKEQKFDSIDPSSIPAFQQVWLKEGAAYINLLSMGEGKFLVVSTNRNTLKEDDLLVAITTPWNASKNDGFEFDILRDGNKFIPKELPKTTEFIDYQIKYHFKTKPIDEIWFYTSPEIYDIVDTNFSELKEGKSAIRKKIESAYAFKFVEYITDIVNKYGFEGKYYDALIDYSCNKCGVSSYILNLIIELLDKKKRRKSDPVFTNKDWDWNIPEEIELRIKEERIKRKAQQVKDLQAQYLDNLKKKLEQGKFLVIFKRSGYFSKQSEAELKGISDKLDELYNEGFGIKDWANSEKNNFLKKYQVNKKDNVIIAAKAFGTIAVIILVAVITLATISGLSDFSKAAEQADLLLIDKKYDQAREAYTAAYQNYSPGLTSFLAKFKYNAALEKIDAAIIDDIEKGIISIKASLDADNGKFRDFTKDELFRLLELNPEHPGLLELKELWIRQ